MTEFNLSEKREQHRDIYGRIEGGDDGYYPEEDIKEFIRLLKKLTFDVFFDEPAYEMFRDRIDKLAGVRLTGGEGK